MAARFYLAGWIRLFAGPASHPTSYNLVATGDGKIHRRIGVPEISQTLRQSDCIISVASAPYRGYF